MQARRDEAAEKSEGAAEASQDFLDCNACRNGGRLGVPAKTDAERASWNCGWIPKSRRRPSLTRPFPETNVCPGYVIQQPEVYEAARARSWREKGQLQHLYDEPATPALRDAIDILDAACGEQERASLRRQRREVDRGRTG